MNTKIQVSVAILTLLLLVKSGFPVFASQALQLSQASTQSVDPRKAEADKLQQQGKELADKGQPQAALQVLQQALTLYRDLKDQAGEGSTLRRIGNAYNDLKDYPKALEYQQQALAIAQAIKDQNLEARALNNIGLAYVNLKDSKNAIEFYQKSLSVSQQHQNYEMQAITLNNLGELYKGLNKYEQASNFYEKSAEAARKGQFFNREIIALNNLGNLYLDLKEYSKSLEYYRSSLLIAQRQKNREGERVAHYGMGKTYDTMGEFTKAINSYKESLTIARELDDRVSEVVALSLIGINYGQQGNALKSIEYLQQSLVIIRELGINEREFGQLQLIAGAYWMLGDSNQSIDYLQKSLKLAKDMKYVAGQVQALAGIGSRYTMLGNYSRAIESFEQAINISKESTELEVQKVLLQALMEFQKLYTEIGEKTKVDEQTKELLSVIQRTKDPKLESIVLRSIGDAYLKFDVNRALKYFRRSLDLAEQNNDSISQVRASMRLGQAYFSIATDILHSKVAQEIIALRSIPVTGKQYTQWYKTYSSEALKQMINYSKSALKILREKQFIALDKNIPELTLLVNLSQAYSLLGDKKAVDYAHEAVALSQKNSVQGQALKISTLINLANTYNNLDNKSEAVGILRKAVIGVRETSDLSLQVLALGKLGIAIYGDFLVTANSVNLAEAETALFEAIEILENLRGSLGSQNDLKISIFEEQQDTYRELEDVLIARNNIEKALEVTERGRARTFAEQLAQRLSDFSKASKPVSQNADSKPLNIQQIKILSQQQNATFVVYSIGRGPAGEMTRALASMANISIWVVKPSGEVSFRQINPFSYAPSLEGFVTASRQAIGVRGRSDIEIATSIDSKDQPQKLRQLHQLLIEPIADLLPTNPSDRVVFMPQGSLFLVPFPALQDANGKYLIEKHTILTAPSIQVLQQTRQLKATWQANTNKGKALVLGNPVMPKVALSPGRPPQPLTPLPGAEREAIAIAPLLNTQPILGNQATKAAIVQKMPQANIIHLATHGLLDDQRGLGSAIALAPDPTQPEDRFGRSNGLLTAEEILDMQLNADLVVLSACDTGRGRITGDGVIGLSRSFISAGVPSVIVSLWAVPDAPTAELMTEFYKNWKERNLDKAQALRQAMITTMKTHPNPRDWAAFTLIGEAE